MAWRTLCRNTIVGRLCPTQRQQILESYVYHPIPPHRLALSSYLLHRIAVDGAEALAVQARDYGAYIQFEHYRGTQVGYFRFEFASRPIPTFSLCWLAQDIHNYGVLAGYDETTLCLIADSYSLQQGGHEENWETSEAGPLMIQVGNEMSDVLSGEGVVIPVPPRPTRRVPRYNEDDEVAELDVVSYADGFSDAPTLSMAGASEATHNPDEEEGDASSLVSSTTTDHDSWFAFLPQWQEVTVDAHQMWPWRWRTALEWLEDVERVARGEDALNVRIGEIE